MCIITLISLLFLLTSGNPAGASNSLHPHSNHQWKHKIEQPAQADIEPANKLGIVLESMEDLEHICYLSMRNFNMTDESLLQSSWLMGIGTVLPHKQQHLKASLTQSSSVADVRQRLSLMLESFISHLRNGHLRRLSLSELEAIANNLVPEPQESPLSGQSSPDHQPDTDLRSNQFGRLRPERDDDKNQSASLQSEEAQPDRCQYLVAIYKHELVERHKSSRLQQLQQQNEQQVSPTANLTANFPTGSDDSLELQPLDTSRLNRLCELVVRCNTAEELVSLIGGSWKRIGSQLAKQSINRRQSKSTTFHDHSMSPERMETSGVPRNLRESLSLSLAKLCPLILFQLHEDDGFCAVRRDDRPPLVTVWGFATLFVTIVCFCSLIGLSITPLLGPTSTTNVSSSSSSSSSSATFTSSSSSNSLAATSGQRTRLARQTAAEPPNHSHKACLTLFEGLAVGSLVGSALFSLIPQAFELQERESNQGFLLKALIIFFGIYLFFCSERIMRIILDTRQRRKKQKRISHLSSNSIASHHPINTDQRQAFALGAQLASESVAGGSCYIGGTENNRKQNRRQFNSRTKVVNFWGSSKPKKNMNEEENYNSAPEQSADSIKSAIGLTGVATRRRHRRRKTRRELRKHRLRRIRHQQQLPVRIKNLSDSEFVPAKLKQLGSSSSSLSSEIRQALPGAPIGEFSKQLRRNLQDSSQFDESNAYNSDDYDDEDSKGQTYQLCGRRFPRGPESEWSDEEGVDAQLQQMRAISKHMNRHLSKGMLREGNQQLGAGRNAENPRSPRQKRRARLQAMSSVGEEEAERLFSTYQEAPLSRPESGLRQRWPEVIMPVKQDISTVAWMIVLGDGLHNFIDGISIGAAFSESILSGVSISVAVICEEFPHELGDFAVLVSAGMTVRQALGYNFLSACTCYLGMAVGIILGDVNDGASYISALAAGVFLYIALVDMMGELSATLEETSRESITRTLKFLLLQNIGIFIGISIIFVLSFIDF